MATPLKTLRERIGVTQEQLARDLDVAVLSVRMWEAKKSRPMKVHARRLAEYLDVPLAEIELKPDRLTVRLQREQSREVAR